MTTTANGGPAGADKSAFYDEVNRFVGWYLAENPVMATEMGLHAYDNRLADTSPEALARVTAQRRARYGWDFVKFQPRASCFAGAFGAEPRGANHSPRAALAVSPPIQPYTACPSLPATCSRAPPPPDRPRPLAIGWEVAAIRCHVHRELADKPDGRRARMEEIVV